MDGSSAKKSTSLETLVIQNITNLNDLKTKLGDIIQASKDYEYDVSSCLKTLLSSSDQEIVVLTVQAISELAKCENKRETYAQKDVIQPIISILDKEINYLNLELVKQCCRALGNLCCDCDASRTVLLEINGVPVLIRLLEQTLAQSNPVYGEIKLLVSKTLLNFAIGGSEFSDAIIQAGILDILHKILSLELDKEDMNDDVVSTCLLILSVINDNTPEYLFEEKVNKDVLNVLRETTNVEISELCLDHLHAQAEHDSVKNMVASEGGVQLVCTRLEQLMARREAGDVSAEDSEIDAIIKQACDLIIIILTGDDAMNMLYNNGVGEVYLSMVRWLDSRDWQLLTTGVLAVGNFARRDDYCAQMMQDRIFDKLLDILEVYHGFGVRMQKDPDAVRPVDPATVTKVQHAVLSALRNLIVPVANKSVARQLATHSEALASVARWGHAGQCAGAAGEAPRLLAWAAKQLRHSSHWRQLVQTVRSDAEPQAHRTWIERDGAVAAPHTTMCTVMQPNICGIVGDNNLRPSGAGLLAWAAKQLRHSSHWRQLVQVEGCVSSLVNMLVVCHSVMQNEAILALTLLAIESLNNKTPTSEAPSDFDYEKSFTSQLIKSEIGKHVAVLIDTNCAKMPMEVAENLLAFLDITSKKNDLASDYKETKVHESLKKFCDSRNDFSDDLKACINGVVTSILNNAKAE
ncbi:GTPase-GDP dissociation stimulator vimar [Ostrinia nubilalis]|uniref:GTPase-GDP dissociation stimulator vimar n=1 Tax=Ostrinia nubilalis TaxID=29057 RepID=UPI00308232D4